MLTQGVYLADRYEVVGKVGAGGMSDVYKAKDHKLGRFVAIKVLKQEFSDDVNFVTKFRTEAQSAAGLEHPNIVNIYDVGSENGLYYIIMEYIEGITLKTYIEKKGQLSYKEAVSIAIQVGRGIEAAHNKRIIHRDIKPQNIIISTEGKVKVTDFGIARAVNNNTIHSDVMGSVHYSSPEQARNGFVDGKSDIYSLGIVMYEMVTGRVPFDGDTTVAIAIQHLQEEMIVPGSYAPDLPVSMEKIILKCTQKSPDRRYETMGDLLLDLKKVLISPDEDFVTLYPNGQDKTRIIEPEEVDAIKKETGKILYKEQKAKKVEVADDDDDDEDDEEESGFLNPKMEKAVTIMGIVAAVIIVVIIIYILGSVFNLFKFGGGTKDKDKDNDVKVEEDAGIDKKEPEEETEERVTMIDLTGKTVEEAKTELYAMGLGILETGVEPSEDIEFARIIRQDIAEGDKVAKNTTINVIVSSGPGQIAVPDVKGIDKNAANAKLTEMGLVPQPEYQYNSTVPNDSVISQEPEAGTMLKKGDAVTYYISMGAQLVQMPDVTNKTEAEARAELTNLGLVVSDVNSENSETIPAGNVIRQSEATGKFLDPGANVALWVSIGKKTSYYSYSTVIESPGSDENKKYTAYVELFKSESDESIPLNGSSNGITVTSFPTTVSAEGIADCESGTLVIIWEVTEIDEDGKSSTKKLPTEELPVTFKPQ